MIGSRTLLFTIILTLIAASSASATSFFVTQAGAGSHTGLSQLDAWSVANFNASGAIAGGDTVLFLGTITSTVVPNTNGSSGNPVTLDFTGAILTPPGIRLSGRSNLTMLGGTFAGGSNGATMVACETASTNITVSGFTFTGGSNGVDGFVEAARGCNNWTVDGNLITNVAGCVTFTGGPISNWTISNNLCASNSVITSSQTDMLFLPDASHITISGNKLVQRAPGQTGCCHNDAIQTFRSGAGGAVNPNDFIIRYNWIERSVPAGGSGDNSWMEIEGMTGNPAMRIYGNIFVGMTPSIAGGNGISIHSGTSSSDTYFFYNNTVYRHQQPGNAIRLGEGDGPGQLFFRNNIAAQDTACNCQMTQVTFTVGAQWNRNFFTSNWDSCNSNFTGPNGSCNAVPSFVSTSANNFSLQPGSQLIDAGDSTIGAEYNQGIAAGATWPNPTLVARSAGSWDVGAYQSGTAGAPPDPPVGLAAVVQ